MVNKTDFWRRQWIVKRARVNGTDCARKFRVFSRIGHVALSRYQPHRHRVFVNIGHSSIAYDNGHSGKLEISAQVPNQVGQIEFVFVDKFGIDPVVPALMPAQSCDFKAFVVVGRIVLFHICQNNANLGKHFGVIRAGRAAGARRPKVHCKRLAAPRSFDEKYFVSQSVADCVPKAKLGANVARWQHFLVSETNT